MLTMFKKNIKMMQIIELISILPIQQSGMKLAMIFPVR